MTPSKKNPPKSGKGRAICRSRSNSRDDVNRPLHGWLYALPNGRMPSAVKCKGERYLLERVFKHDFFAATGLYSGPEGLAVLKMGRINDIFSFPGGWIGEFLTRREVKHYELAEDLPGVPRYIGMTSRHGFLHEYVPGRPLDKKTPVSDSFFDELAELLRTLHARGLAYVDLNKPQNILLGDDGKPYLIDFQISLYAPRQGWRGLRLVQWTLRRFQQADLYHYLKHKRRMRADLLTPAELSEGARVNGWIKLHRAIARPITNLRRRLLKRLERSETAPAEGSSAK